MKQNRRKLPGFSIEDVPFSSNYKKPPERSDFRNDRDLRAALASYKVSNSLTNMMEHAKFHQPVDMERVLNLRFSSLPFCSVRWFLNLPQKLNGTNVSDFGSKFFTSVGTTVHTVFQDAVHNSPSFHALNDYICTSCRKRYVLRMERPKKCSCGSILFRRDEHEVLWRGAIGHVDENVVPDINYPKRVFILDYKTTSLKNLHKKDSIQYSSQIKSYGVALTDAGYEVLGCGLVYVPRDNPYKFRMSELPFNQEVYAKSLSWLEFWLAEHKKGMNVETPRDALELLANRPCREKVLHCYQDCEHKSYCGEDNVDHPAEMKRRVRQAYNEIKIWLPLKIQREKPRPSS
jgi:hypothetical protein